jgi:hypothetical protein
LDDEVRDAVAKARVTFSAELKAELEKLRADLREMVKEVTQDRPPPRPAVNKPLAGYQSPGSMGGSF